MKNRMRKSMFALLGAGVLSLAPASAHAVMFDTDGVGGGLPTLNIGGIDWLPASAYSLGGNTAFLNAANGTGVPTFTTFFHASAGQLVDGAGNAIFSPSTAGVEYTIVARFDETVTFAFGAPVNIATFSYTPSALEFLEIYYDATPDANPLAGTGYNDGRLIMRADITAINSTFQLTDNFTDNGVLSVNDNAAAPDFRVDVDDLDQSSNGNQVPNVKTTYGTGATTVFANVVDFDTAFFKTNPGSLVFDILTTTQTLPFGSTDPSNAYVTGANGGLIGNVAGGPAPVGQNIGAGVAGSGIGKVNGHNSSIAIPGDYIPPGGPLGLGLGGPDILFQTDASNDFSALGGVPEPLTATLGLLSLGALGLGLGRRRQA